MLYPPFFYFFVTAITGAGAFTSYAFYKRFTGKEKNKGLNYLLYIMLALSTVVCIFFFYESFLLPNTFAEFAKGINSFVGLIGSSIVMSALVYLLHTQGPTGLQDEPQGLPETPVAPQETQLKLEQKPAPSAAAPVQKEAEPEKLTRTMLKGLVTMEATVLLDEDQLDHIATIVTERQQLQQTIKQHQTTEPEPEQAAEPENAAEVFAVPTEVAAASAEAVPVQAAPHVDVQPEQNASQEAGKETAEEAVASEKHVPLIRHVKRF